MELRLSDALGLKNSIDEALDAAAKLCAANNQQRVTTIMMGADPKANPMLAEKQYFAADEERDRWVKLMEYQVKLKTAINVASTPVRGTIEQITAIGKEVNFLKSIPTHEEESSKLTGERYDPADQQQRVLTKISATIKPPEVQARLAELGRLKKKAQRALNAFNHETKITVDFEETEIPFDPAPLIDETEE